MKKEASELLRLSETLFQKAERTAAIRQWKEQAKYLLNNQYSMFDTGYLKDSAPGGARMDDVQDITGPQSVQELSAAFNTALTNSATTWAAAEFRDPELRKDKDINKYLFKLNQVTFQLLRDSNMGTEMFKGYQSLCTFGNDPLFFDIIVDPNKLTITKFNFTALHIGQVAYASSNEGIVDTIYIKEQYTVKQAAQEFGIENLSPSLRNKLKIDPFEDIEFVRCIYQRDPSEVFIDKRGFGLPEQLPFANVCIEVETGHIVEEKGFYEFPVFVSRWSLEPGAEYGRGPGHIALPAVKRLNKVHYLGMQSLELEVAPPWLATQKDVIGSSFDLRSNGITYVRNKDALVPLRSNSNLGYLQYGDHILTEAVRRAFFIDKILLPPRTETGEMSAYEVATRVEQLGKVVGPVVSRISNEKLKPMLQRAYDAVLRHQLAGPMPAKLQEHVRQNGFNIEFIFVNQLAKSQEMQEFTAMQQALQFFGGLAQFNPEVIDVVDFDFTAKEAHKLLGAPTDMIRDQDQIDGIRQARAQQQQQQAELQQANLLADTAAKASGIQAGEGQ